MFSQVTEISGIIFLFLIIETAKYVHGSSISCGSFKGGHGRHVLHPKKKKEREIAKKSCTQDDF